MPYFFSKTSYLFAETFYFKICFKYAYSWASQVALVVKNLLASAGDMRPRFDPWVGKICWRRAWQPTPVFLSGESHGQRNLMGYSPWAHKESDITRAT